MCDRALLGAYVQGKEQVDVKTLVEAAREASGGKGHRSGKVRFYRAVAVALFLVLCASLGTAYLMGRTPLWRRSLHAQVQPTAVSQERTDTGEPAAPVRSDGARNEEDMAGAATLVRPPGMSGPMTRERALAALFREWHGRYDGRNGNDVSAQALALGLSSFSAAGSLGDLRYMNKPAVLTFKDEKGLQYYGTLTSLRGDKAVVTIGDETRRVDASEVVKSWSGDYLILWREPPLYRGALKQGQSGPMVAWIEERLALAQGRPFPDGGTQTYDRRLAERVKRFQLVNGMAPDGIVGRRTVIGLGGVVMSGDPSLYPEKGGG